MAHSNDNKEYLSLNFLETPNAVALITNSSQVTFKSLSRLVENAANKLLNAEVSNNCNCAIISENNIDFIISVIALWKIGAVPVPLNIRLTNQELNNQIKFTDCAYVLIHKEIKSKFSFETGTTVIEIPFYDSVQPIDSDYEIELNFDKNSLILFTSGSSDKPKAVVFTFGNFHSSALQTYKLSSARQNDTWLASLPLYHIGGFMIFIRALFNRSTLLLPGPLTNESLTTFINEHNPSFISFVSTQLLRITSAKTAPNSKLKALFIGGGPIEKNMLLEAIKLGWPIIKVYGSTETCSMVSALDLRKKLIKLDSAGKAIQENSITILGINKGEVLIEGLSVANGYYKEESQNLINGKFHSNDYGFIDEDGYLFIEGRIDDIIISGGENINANEITNTLLEDILIADAYTFGVKDKQWGQSVACAVVPAKTGLNENMIRDYLKSKIASYKIPKNIYIIKSIPKTDLGKVRKEELLKMLSLY